MTVAINKPGYMTEETSAKLIGRMGIPSQHTHLGPSQQFITTRRRLEKTQLLKPKKLGDITGKFVNYFAPIPSDYGTKKAVAQQKITDTTCFYPRYQKILLNHCIRFGE
jgi:hypothetical protein